MSPCEVTQSGIMCTYYLKVKKRRRCVGSRGAVVSAALSERKIAGSIPTIGDFHTVGHVRRQSLAVWPPTLNKIPLPLLLPSGERYVKVFCCGKFI